MWLGGVIWPGPFDISAAVEIPRQNRELNQSRNEHDGLRTGDRLCRARAAAGGVAGVGGRRCWLDRSRAWQGMDRVLRTDRTRHRYHHRCLNSLCYSSKSCTVRALLLLYNPAAGFISGVLRIYYSSSIPTWRPTLPFFLSFFPWPKLCFACTLIPIC